MDIFPTHISSRESLIQYATQYVIAEIRDISPLTSIETGGILRREFGITGNKYRGVKREIISELQKICYAVKGCDDCLEEDYDVIVYYTDRGQYEIFHNELF